MKRTTMTVLALIAVTSLPAALVYAQNAIPPVYDSTGAMLTAIAPQPTANPRALPWVYDATGAMQASVAPQPAKAGLPPVLPESLTAARLEERMEAQRDAAALAEITRIYGRGDTLESKAIIPPVYDATGAMQAAIAPESAAAAVSPDTLRTTSLSERLEAQNDAATIGAIPPVYDSTAVMQAAMGPNAQSASEQYAATQGITRYIEAHEALNLDSGIPPVYDATGAQQAAVVRSDKADAQDVVPPTVTTTRTDPSMYLVIGLGLLAAATLIGAWRLSHHRPIHRHGPRHV